MTLTESQIAALYGMFLLGLFSLISLAHAPTRFWRIVCIVWVVVWVGPPLALLWIKGVVG